MANWTPDGFIGQLFKVMGRYLPPPPGVKPPSLWGTEARLREPFKGEVRAERRNFVFRYRSPKHWLQTFRTYYGPMHKAFGALDAAQQASLGQDLLALVQGMNTATDGTMSCPGNISKS